jgi:hypothetical protein
MTHTKCCYFNVLLCLTSPILTACHNIPSPLYSMNIYSNGWSFILVLVHWWWATSQSGRFIWGPVVKKALWASVAICLLRTIVNTPHPVSAWYLRSFSCPACSLVTILTERPRLPLALHTWLMIMKQLLCWTLFSSTWYILLDFETFSQRVSTKCSYKSKWHTVFMANWVIYTHNVLLSNILYAMFQFHRAFQFTIHNGPTNALVCNKTLVQMSHIKTLKITPTCFDHLIIIRELFIPS